MNLASVMRSEQKVLLPTYDRQKVLFEKGRGVYLWDSQGNRYLDFLSGIGVNALGHRHPAIQAVLKRQAGRLIHVSNLFFHPYQAELAERLSEISGLDRAFFCNSGTEAWEGALKLARAYARTLCTNGHKPKWRILALENSFHGRTFGSLATTGQAKYRDPFGPLLPGVSFVEFNDVADLRRQLDGSVCAVCLETIQGEGGIRPVSTEFLRAARELTKKSGALLILDEIQCGLGRTGRYFAYQHYGVQPDIVTVAKPLAAGLPLGAILTNNRVASAIHIWRRTAGLCGCGRIPASVGPVAGAGRGNREILPRETGMVKGQTQLRGRSPRHGLDACDGTEFCRSCQSRSEEILAAQNSYQPHQ
jgi:acetylornithine aminotransferase/acetylornithine/N-succinyldiaminopimelate aminotransferase